MLLAGNAFDYYDLRIHICIYIHATLNNIGWWRWSHEKPRFYWCVCMWIAMYFNSLELEAHTENTKISTMHAHINILSFVDSVARWKWRQNLLTRTIHHSLLCECENANTITFYSNRRYISFDVCICMKWQMSEEILGLSMKESLNYVQIKERTRLMKRFRFHWKKKRSCCPRIIISVFHHWESIVLHWSYTIVRRY